jgi:signal transduction histidine kinase
MDDLQMPAEAIVAHCQSLLDEAESTLTEQQQDFIRTMQNNGQRFCAQLVALHDRIEEMRAGKGYHEIGHELRSPLTTIFGYNHLLLNGMMGEITPQQREHLQQIEQSSTHLRDTLDQLFDNARREV